ncbi:hypothetical protein RXV95_11860 [Novosphingobium sp. ZN18A2]|uniref:NUDIX hydrolase n=1 Tax=Novosphingobium sp. ZN18A2 TaxID=3079861 RepID=UPI0030D2FE6B
MSPLQLSIEIVLLTVHEGSLHVVMREREDGLFYLPGAFVQRPTRLEHQANSILMDQVGPVDVKVEQFHTFADPGRDPRGWMASVGFLGTVQSAWILPHVGVSHEMQLIEVEVHDELAQPHLSLGGLSVRAGLDHDEIIVEAVRHLRRILDWSMLGFQLVPGYFTLLELQQAHEAVLNRSLNKPLFRKRMLERIFSDGSKLKPTKYVRGGAHRPAKVFELAKP